MRNNIIRRIYVLYATSSTNLGADAEDLLREEFQRLGEAKEVEVLLELFDGPFPTLWLLAAEELWKTSDPRGLSVLDDVATSQVVIPFGHKLFGKQFHSFNEFCSYLVKKERASVDTNSQLIINNLWESHFPPRRGLKPSENRLIRETGLDRESYVELLNDTSFLLHLGKSAKGLVQELDTKLVELWKDRKRYLEESIRRWKEVIDEIMGTKRKICIANILEAMNYPSEELLYLLLDSLIQTGQLNGKLGCSDGLLWSTNPRKTDVEEVRRLTRDNKRLSFSELTRPLGVGDHDVIARLLEKMTELGQVDGVVRCSEDLFWSSEPTDKDVELVQELAIRNWQHSFNDLSLHLGIGDQVALEKLLDNMIRSGMIKGYLRSEDRILVTFKTTMAELQKVKEVVAQLTDNIPVAVSILAERGDLEKKRVGRILSDLLKVDPTTGEFLEYEGVFIKTSQTLDAIDRLLRDYEDRSLRKDSKA